MAKLFTRVVAWVALLLGVLTLLFFVLVPPMADKAMNPVVPHAPYEISDEAAALHETIPVADLHSDTMLWNRNIHKRNDRGHVDLPRMREGGMFLQVFTAVTKSPAGQNYEENDTDAADNITTLALGQRWPMATWSSLEARAVYQAQRLHRFAENDEQFSVILTRGDLSDAYLRWQGRRGLARSLAETGDDLDAIALSLIEEVESLPTTPGIVVGILGIEGSHPLEGDLAAIDRLYDEGYRLMGLQHFFDNELGGSLHGTSATGLSAFGREAVARMNELSIVIDVAHSSPQTVRDTLALSNQPLVVSHTGFNGHCESPRNISDELMGEIVAAGGLIGVGFWEDVTCDASPAGIADAIIYGIEAFGADHIALGSDFDGTVATELDASELAAITQALMDRDVADDDIRRVMGLNTVEFFLANLPTE
ncbi:MAG: membrane dipeptidase [Pseudomonadota bacterium]